MNIGHGIPETRLFHKYPKKDINCSFTPISQDTNDFNEIL